MTAWSGECHGCKVLNVHGVHKLGNSHPVILKEGQVIPLIWWQEEEGTLSQ